MARRLTAFSKFLITVAILAVIFFAGRYVLNNTEFGRNLKEQAQTEQKESEYQSDQSGADTGEPVGRIDKSGDRVLRVQLVTWGGYAPGLFWNNGAKANRESRFFQDYGFKVDFKLENDLINAMNAWISDEYDVIVQTADAFPLYTAPNEINEFGPKAFIQVDWSRGGDAIIAKRGINTINDLQGKRIAVAVPSPAQTLLVSALEAAGMKYEDVRVIKTTDNLKAAELFRSEDVDAAVVWSPDDILATRDVPGSKILLTTAEQSHIIADIMLAKESFIRNNQEMIHDFYEGWMKGVAEMKKSEVYKEEAAKHLAALNGIAVEDAKGMMSTVYWTGHEDNVNFFGLNPDYRGQKGQDVYSKMNRMFVRTGDAESQGPSWRSVIYTGAIQDAESTLTGPEYAAEGTKEFSPPTQKERTSPALAVKPITIKFNTGQYKLDPNAKSLIDLQFADVAKSFANTRVRIEGNTDNVGSREMNMRLSRQRAQSVADYLESEYGISPNRFVIVGNGPDNPVPGCEDNATAECRAKNRRTEFQLIAD
ncbi:MAG: phosphate ABC transporter substrate-binding/OmpA family protein [Saprospiraceae bacterium]|nr:phosphate ABC transporter substrate-binding/OmpA family protein [Saprospiraceae bacterium]